MTAETPPSKRTKAPGEWRYEIRRLHQKYDRLNDRMGRIEKAIYIMIGVGSATSVTAIYNLLNGLGVH